MTNPLRLYNPRDCPPDALEAMTVGRESILTDIIADIRRQAHDSVRQPWLLHAPRGFGKTHLLAMLNHRILADPGLRDVIVPIWLPESDAFVAFDLRSFLDQVLDHLADNLPSDSAAAARIRTAIGSDPSPAGIAIREECLAAEASEAGVTYVVFYENFDVLATVLDRSPASRDSKRLRAILTQPKYPVFVFTTAVDRFAAVDSASRPMHQLFRSRHLAPLTEDDAADLSRRVYAMAPRLPVDRSGQASELEAWDRARVRTFHQLTGGSPRSTLIATSAIGAANGIDALVEELKSLLDANTPTFEQRLADLAPRERAIVSAMALAPTTLTMREIAKQSGLPERSLSTQVERLVDAGWVGEAHDNGGKGSLYEIHDGLFRVWFQYRRGNKILAPLVRFLALWFAPDELSASLGRAQEEDATSSSSLEHLREACALAAQPEIQVERASVLADSAPADVSPSDHSESSVDAGRANAELQVALQTMKSAKEHRAAGRFDEAGKAYNEVVRLFGHAPDAALREQVARALFNSAYVFGDACRNDDAIASYQEVVQRFGDAPEAVLREHVANALYNRAHLLKGAGRTEDAVASYEEVLRRFGDAPHGALRETVAQALINRGVELKEAGRNDDAIASYDDVIRRFGDAPEAALREKVAIALYNRGVALRYCDEAIASYEEVLRRFGDASEAELQRQVASALFNHACVLREVGRIDEAIASFEELPRRYGDASEEALRKQVAKALVRRGIALSETGRRDDAIKSWEDVLHRFGDAPEAALRKQVAMALFNRGVALGEVDRYDEEIASYEELLQRFGDAPEAGLREWIAMALFNRASVLASTGRNDDAIVSYGEVLQRFGDAPEIALRKLVAMALFSCGELLRLAGRLDDAIASYEDLLRRFGDAPERLRMLVAIALSNRGALLRTVDRLDDAIASYDEVLRRFGDAPEPALRAPIAGALVNRGLVLGEAGRDADAITSYEEVLLRFAGATEGTLKASAAFATAGLVATLARIGDAPRCSVHLRSLATLASALPSADRPPLFDAIEEAVSRFALADVREWLTPFRESIDGDLKATAQLCDYVINVVEASEGTGTSNRGSAATSARHALARVPAELRATVREIAGRVRKTRELRKTASLPPVS